jgi:hypothetical protein
MADFSTNLLKNLIFYYCILPLTHIYTQSRACLNCLNYSSLINFSLCAELFLFCFADDTALTASNSNLDGIYDYVITKYLKTLQLFTRNKLSVHLEKTQYLLISPNATVNSNIQI